MVNGVGVCRVLNRNPKPIDVAVMPFRLLRESGVVVRARHDEGANGVVVAERGEAEVVDDAGYLEVTANAEVAPHLVEQRSLGRAQESAAVVSWHLHEGVVGASPGEDRVREADEVALELSAPLSALVDRAVLAELRVLVLDDLRHEDHEVGDVGAVVREGDLVAG